MLFYWEGYKISFYLKSLTPSPCGHSPYISSETQGERFKTFSNSSPAVSRSITGCFAWQNIGEVSEGRRG